MIKGISILRPAGSAAAYDRLARFFSALGFEPGRGWDEENSHGAAFLAPLGNLEIVDGEFPSTADLLVEVTALDAVYQAAESWLRAEGGDAAVARLTAITGGRASLPSSRSRGLRAASGPGQIRCGPSRWPSRATSPPRA